MESCLYEGVVVHHRTGEVDHRFGFPLCMVYLDLAELSEVFAGRWLWSSGRPALAWFRRRDHLGDPRIPLDEAVRRLVARRTGRVAGGPIRLLTHLRSFGYLQNPISVYYCFSADGSRVEHLVADVTNTPWGERHQYVLSWEAAQAPGAARRAATPKAFHVSPFMGLDQTYGWRVGRPGRQLSLAIDSGEAGRGRVFGARLRLRRREIGAASLARALLRYPAGTLGIAAGIYWQALRLHLRGARFHPHPHPRSLSGTPRESHP